MAAERADFCEWILAMDQLMAGTAIGHGHTWQFMVHNHNHGLQEDLQEDLQDPVDGYGNVPYVWPHVGRSPDI